MRTNQCIIAAAGFAAVVGAGASGGLIDPGNLLVNGGFESSSVSGAWSYFDSIEGWSSSFGSPFEIQVNHRGWLPAEGNQYLELDSTSRAGGHGIYQDVETIAGEMYELSLWFSPRPNVGDNRLQVLWDGAVVGEYSASGSGKSNTDWQFIELELNATQSISRVEFRHADAGDSYGPFIDGVDLRGAVPTPGTAVLAFFAGGMLTRRRR